MTIIIPLVIYAEVAESADASDLKSGGGNTVWVQVPSSPPLKDLKIARNSGFFVFVLFFRTFAQSMYLGDIKNA